MERNLVFENCDMLIEFINNLLGSDSVSVDIIIDNITNDKNCIFKLEIPSKNYSKFINTNLEKKNIGDLLKHLMFKLLEEYTNVEKNTLITKCYFKQTDIENGNFAINIYNDKQSVIKIKFNVSYIDLIPLVNDYNYEYDMQSKNKYYK